MDAHSEAVNLLCEASPVLVAHCSSSDKLLVQTELSDVSKQWADIEKTWKKRETEMDDVKGTATQYHNTHDALLARLTDLEQRLAKKPPVGTELEVVIKQLKEQKVCVSLKWHLVLFIFLVGTQAKHTANLTRSLITMQLNSV